MKNSLARKTRGKPGLEKTGSPARVSPWKYLYLHPRFSRRSTLVPMTTRLGWETTASRKEKRRDLCSSAEEHLCFRARARHNGVLRNAVEKRGKKKKKKKTSSPLWYFLVYGKYNRSEYEGNRSIDLRLDLRSERLSRAIKKHRRCTDTDNIFDHIIVR